MLHWYLLLNISNNYTCIFSEKVNFLICLAFFCFYSEVDTSMPECEAQIQMGRMMPLLQVNSFHFHNESNYPQFFFSCLFFALSFSSDSMTDLLSSHTVIHVFILYIRGFKHVACILFSMAHGRKCIVK